MNIYIYIYGKIKNVPNHRPENGNKYEGFHNWGTPRPLDGLCHRKSHLEVVDDSGYPYDPRKPHMFLYHFGDPLNHKMNTSSKKWKQIPSGNLT